MHSIKFISTVIAALMLNCAGVQAQAPTFNVTVLINSSLLDYASGTNLNNKGEVLGGWGTPKDTTGGLLIYPNETIINLWGLTSHTCGTGESLQILNFNDEDQIVGRCNFNAMLYSLAAGPIELTNNTSAPYGSTAVAINNAEQIVGYINTGWEGENPQAAVFFQNGTIIDIQSVGSTSIAYDINESYGEGGLGQIVGYFTSEYNLVPSAFLYENGFMYNISQIVCSDEPFSMAEKINNKGAIAGCCYNISDTYIDCYDEFNGFIYESDTGNYEIFPECQLFSINDAGWAIGNAFYLNEHACLINNGVGCLIISGTKYNLLDLILPSFGITEVWALDINDQGQILAWTNLGTVLLTPIR